MPDNDRISLPVMTLVHSGSPTPPLQYALDELVNFCRASPQIEAKRVSRWDGHTGVPILVGRAAATAHLPGLCERIDWDDLGREGFVLRCVIHEGKPVFIAAGSGDIGTRQAIYELLRSLDVTTLPPTLPARLDIRSKPSFELRGMYAHQHWAYNHPYSLRTWTVDEWFKYVDMLALMRVNLFQIWSMVGILPMPLSSDDEQFLRRYPPVIDHARENHGMEVYIGECANNMCDRREVPPIARRHYFDVECLKDPSDPAQMEELRKARAEFYRICNNADGYWVLDSDPGGWQGSPAHQFVDMLMMNRRLIDEHARLGRRANLVYWMWIGWGNKEREDNWRDTVDELMRRHPEPWAITASWEGHWKVIDERDMGDRVIYYPYGAVEPEPSLPFTTVVPRVIHEVLNVPDRVGRIRGIMGNAQSPLCQLPNVYYFTRASWSLDRRDDERSEVVAELARLVYPERAELLTRCWLILSSSEALQAKSLADELQGLIETRSLGRPGPIGLKLFPDYEQVARDLVVQLRIHGIAMTFCRMADNPRVNKARLLDELKHYCLLSLHWRRRNGFRRYGANGYNFFPVREAAHKHWWQGDCLDEGVCAELESAMNTEFEPWEAELLLRPLKH